MIAPAFVALECDTCQGEKFEGDMLYEHLGRMHRDDTICRCHVGCAVNATAYSIRFFRASDPGTYFDICQACTKRTWRTLPGSFCDEFRASYDACECLDHSRTRDELDGPTSFLSVLLMEIELRRTYFALEIAGTINVR
jgi:hypothetical protein